MKRHLLSLAFLLATLFGVSDNLWAESETAENEIKRIKVGEFDFYCIQDAPSEFNTSVLITEDKELLQRLTPSGKAPGSYNVFVVRKGSETVLIDTGKGGVMLKRLQTLGIKPEDVKTVLLTHSHGDHVGGLVKDGNKVFPNAEIRLSATEWVFWKSSRNKELCEQTLKLYGKPEFLAPDEKTVVVFPELVAVDLAGHTPGQVGFLLSSGKEKLAIAADLLHCGAVQFERPDISCRYDNAPKQAAEIRIKTLRRASEEKWIIVASHLPFPSVGHVESDGNAFRFTPMDDQTLQDFKDKLDDGWSWIREVPEQHRFKDGALEIKMEPNPNEGIRNILVRNVPKKDDGAFVVQLEVDSDKPFSNQYQQVGLYWLKGEEVKFKFVKEFIDGELYVFPGKKPLTTQGVTLRLVIEDNKATGWFEPDGADEFQKACEATLPERNDDDRIAIQCWHGPADGECWTRLKKFQIVRATSTDGLVHAESGKPLPTASPEVTSTLKPYLDEFKIAGIDAVIANKNENILFRNLIGHADFETGRPMLESDVYWVASMTKMFAGASIMMLVDEGKVRLDDPVTKYIPRLDQWKVAGKVFHHVAESGDGK